MRDDDLIEVELSTPPSVALRGVRAVVVAPLVAIALAGAAGCTEPVGIADSGPPPDAGRTFDAGSLDVPAIVNDAGLHYDAGRVDAPGDAPSLEEEDAPAEDAGPPLDVG